MEIALRFYLSYLLYVFLGAQPLGKTECSKPNILGLPNIPGLLIYGLVLMRNPQALFATAFMKGRRAESP